jgi:ankyrin repeat protein
MHHNRNISPLVKAVLDSNFAGVQSALNHNQDPNTKFYGSPIVDFAARKGNLEITKLLVERGAQVSTDVFRFIEDQEVIEYLKSEMSITDKFKLAVNRGKWENVVSLGLQIDNVNIPVDNQGNRLSHILLKIGKGLDIINILNVFKLDMNIKNSCNQTPLDVALEGEFLKNHDSLQSHEIKPLVELVLKLMRFNTDKDFFVKNGLSKIYKILTSQQRDVFKTLIEYNADPSQASPNTQKAIKSFGLLANSSEYHDQSAIPNLEIEEVELTGNADNELKDVEYLGENKTDMHSID